MSEQKIEKITKILIDEPVVTSSDSVSKRIAKRASALNMNGNVLREEVKSTPDKCGDNSIKITMGDIVLNTLNPRQQEIEGNEVIKGISYVFDNKFMAAKALFETKASTDPLHALALSSMAFLKAVMTTADQDEDMALDALNTAYEIANAQLEAGKASSKITGYFSGYYNYLKKKNTSTPSSPTTQSRPPADYPPNGVLRAHVLKAECCLQIAIIQLLQESVLSYVKCGLNLRRAYNSYRYVWQEYQKMGADHLAFMDADTISGVQFGIGSVHLVLSALPMKILKAMSAFGWKPDKQLGFILLNQCVEQDRVRSSMATIMLLAYYSAAISFAPQVMTAAYKKTAMSILLDAQRHHPDSALYLYFAGKLARNSLDLALSTQSFLYAAEISRGEWAEVAVINSCRFEMALNHMITGNWQHAAATFDYLCEQQYWSAAFCRYAQGACYEMMGDRTEAVIIFAEVPNLVVKKLGGRYSDIDAYVLRKVTMFQQSGYQNLDFFVPILEFMCIWNLLPYASHELLHAGLQRINKGLQSIQICEDKEQSIRMKEIAPDAPLPDYFNERASLLIVKSSILNVLGQPDKTTLDINWILDHKDCITSDTWTVPYALWEAGISCWLMELQTKSRQMWEMALDHGKHDFEHRLAVRLNLALTYTEELGYAEVKIPSETKSRYSLNLNFISKNTATLTS